MVICADSALGPWEFQATTRKWYLVEGFRCCMLASSAEVFSTLSLNENQNLTLASCLKVED